jgi:cytochrome b561
VAGEPPAFWSSAQRRLHWGIAALVFTAAPVAVIMVALPFTRLLLKFVLYQAHKTIGLTVLLLAAVQLALHWRRGRPPPDPALPPWQRRAAAAMHAVLFALLLVVPLLGYLTAAAAPIRIPTLFLGVVPVPHVIGPDAALFALLRRVHLVLALTLVALAVGHAAMALHHHFRGRAVLARMLRG